MAFQYQILNCAFCKHINGWTQRLYNKLIWRCSIFIFHSWWQCIQTFRFTYIIIMVFYFSQNPRNNLYRIFHVLYCRCLKYGFRCGLTYFVLLFCENQTNSKHNEYLCIEPCCRNFQIPVVLRQSSLCIFISRRATVNSHVKTIQVSVLCC